MAIGTPRTGGDHVRAFAAAYCRHTVGRWAGLPLVFEPWQQQFVDEAFRLDRHGRRVYQSALLGIARKNGKSALGASLALYLAGPDGEQAPQVILASGSAEQAGVVFGQARSYVEAHPYLAQHYQPLQTSILCHPTRGVIKRVSADGKLQHGLNPHAVVADEVHALVTPRQRELWAAITTGSGAREQPFMLGITTAGFDKDTVLGSYYDKALAHAAYEELDAAPGTGYAGGLSVVRDTENGFLLWWYHVPAAYDLEDTGSWRLGNPASWISTPSLLRTLRRADMDENTFRRLHLNQWTKADGAWLADGVWQRLKAASRDVPKGARIYVGVDVGLTHDGTAVSWAWHRPDGHIEVRCHVWTTRQNSVAHKVVPPPFDLEQAEAFILALAQRYMVAEVVYDPRFFERSAQLLDEAGLPVAQLPQNSAAMADAYSSFFQACNEGTVHHAGDPVLAAHVEAAGAEMTERGWKIRKLRSGQLIDGLVSTVIAHHRAALARRSPYERRGLLTL